MRMEGVICILSDGMRMEGVICNLRESVVQGAGAQ
jgi:hypothetical protein